MSQVFAYVALLCTIIAALAFFIGIYFNSKLNDLLIKFDKNGFFFPNPEKNYHRIIEYTWIDFNHPDFPRSSEGEIRQLKRKVDTCAIMVLLYLAFIIIAVTYTNLYRG